MKLKTLSPKANLRGKRVLLRVDWNVPLGGKLAADDVVKIQRSLPTIRDLSRRGAVVMMLTHLGRPKGADPKFSTRQLLPLLKKKFRLSVKFQTLPLLERGSGRELDSGSVLLLENVRFQSGEEEGDKGLAKRYAALGDLFINDAFASSHRAHVSVAGLAKLLPAYAGPQLAAEVSALSRLLEKPKRPFVAVIGGLKVSSKLPVLKSLLRVCDKLLIGGAMANTFFAAKGLDMGKSFVETESIPEAKKLSKNKKIILPSNAIINQDMVVDAGPLTLLAWQKILTKAKTILWNGPLGIVEKPAFAKGTVALAKMIAGCRAFTVVGGGDTVPLVYRAKLADKFSHVSMGGGALLEFIALRGRLPGLLPLLNVR